MPELFFALGPEDRLEALEAAAARSGRLPHLLEKDVWVVWLLQALFESPLGAHLTFKGGTSLSKAYQVIDRFSEDLDLTYDVRSLVPELASEANALPSNKSQAKRWKEAIEDRLPRWIDTEVIPVLKGALARARLSATLAREDEKHPDRLQVKYPPMKQGTGYVAPQVSLDFGAKSTGEPHSVLEIRCDMAAHLPDVEFPLAQPRVLSIARTFWEKATAVHAYCVNGKLRGDRFSRHWHDLVAIQRSHHFRSVASDRDVANAVAEHKGLFFPETRPAGGAVDYARAIRGELLLSPEGKAREALSEDYRKMIEDGLLNNVHPLEFEELMTSCENLQATLNQMER